MKKFSKTYELMWDDMDMNAHLKHSRYLEYASDTRVSCLNSFGVSFTKLYQMKVSPVIFREEIKFFKELVLGDKLTIHCEVAKATESFRKFTFSHEFYKNEDVLAATLELDGAWIDLTTRKLITRVPELDDLLQRVPKSEQLDTVG